MDIGQWLNAIGLGQYVALFREHEIDAEVLPDLTEADLEKIGVPLGHRKRLMRALAALAATPAPPVAKPAAVSLPPPIARADAERRPITVMFCDLVGSTNLAARLDAEDWRNLLGAYLDEASAAVTSMGGHVLKKLGDGLMALFGYPQAQENDAERAVRAALAIQRALADLNARNARSGAPELSARIGVECGSVVVDAAGEVFGEAPNVAARVQAAAEPGTVLVTASVQRQTAGLFVAEDKGAHDFKGVPAPVTLYRIVRASGAGRRGGARALTPLVGRQDELALLTRRWSRALAGEGQFVQIVGEPGIGKSRLIEEFRAKLAETPHTWVEWAASQLLQNTPLHPLAEWGRLRYGGADASDEQKLADLENTLRLIGLDAAEYAPLLAPLFDVALPEDRAAKFAPEELRRRQLAAMTALFLAGARSQPVVLAFEDLHWADPTSLDLLRALVERGAQAPLLIVATTRPEFHPDWSLRSHHSVISLAPLDRAQVRQMVGEIASRHALSDETIDGVGERTGGVPLFVEEVTRLLLERDAQGGAQAIPPTLQQSLAARLDRLGEAREVAQIGAVLGRDFSYRLLSDVSSSAAGFDELRLQAALDRLAEADLLFVDGAPPAAAYRFKHALIQDAAYESLLKSRRQALHRRAAEALREANAEPEAIAHHFTEAGLDDLAIEWWGKAGDQALRRSAFQEAIAHLGKAIEMADKAGATPLRAGGSAAPSRGLTQLHVAYGNALMAARGFGAPETTEAFAAARERAYGENAALECLASDYGLWAGSYLRGELASMRTHAAAFLAGVAARPDSAEAGIAHRVQGITHYFAGEFIEALRELERALALFQPGRDDDLAFRFAEDPGVVAMTYLAFASWAVGEVERAVSLFERTKARVAGLSHATTLAFGASLAAFFALMRGDRPRAAADAVELARLAREHDLSEFRAYGAFLEGLATADRGALGEGLSDMRRGAELLREQNTVVFDGLLKIALAEAEARAGDPDRALAALDEALATSDRTGHRTFDAELHRARGEMLLQHDPASPAPAEEAFLTALAVAKQQGTRSFELRTALSLARRYQSTARPADAYGVLAPALEGFAPTTEMPEFAEAQALLAALGESDEVRAETARRQRLTQLQVTYGNALIAARGNAAPETTEAFARARESASGDKDAPERLAADYGLWAGSLVRGELPSMRAHAAAFLNDVEARPDSREAGVAHRAAGATCWFAGEYAQARDHLERALVLFEPGRDDDLAFRFGYDAGVGAMGYLAFASWPLGEIDRAISLIDRMQTRIAHLTHVATLAVGRLFAAMFELMRGDHARAAPNAFELARIAREHGLRMWGAFGVFLEGWATAARGAAGNGLEEMRRGVELLREQNVLLFDGLFKIALAEAETRAGDTDRAVTILDDVLATSDRTGHRAFEAELHRARGETLLQRDPANPAPAEDALLTAIAVAKQQVTRSFELRAALSLAKLYQSTARPADAHAVLAPALEGFVPTPEMPEIAEAAALLATLSQTDEVEAQAAQRRRVTQLQVAYGNALIAARGFGAPETTEAFARARESASGDKDAPERLAADYGLWVGSAQRGELPSMRAHASAFLSDVEARPDSPEAGVAHRAAGISCWFAGEYREARDHFERALALFQPGRDDDLAFRFGADPGVAAMAFLAMASWPLGEVDHAILFIDRLQTRMACVSHIGSRCWGTMISALFDFMRGDHARAMPSAFELARLAREQELIMYGAYGVFLEGWVTAASGAPGSGLENMRRGAELLREQNVLLFDGLFKIALAEAEARAGDLDRAIAVLDDALATSDRTGGRAFEAELHRARGEALLARDPANPAPAEDALLNAIAVAKQQGTRSFELRAALSLAKLYQSTGRSTAAHAVLAHALEGFPATSLLPPGRRAGDEGPPGPSDGAEALTPDPSPERERGTAAAEMPEIAEAQTLLAALSQIDEVKVQAAQRRRLTQLHVAYGNAAIAARGPGAPETTEAFARARESAEGDKDAPERLASDYGLWASSAARGDLPSMRAHAAAFLSDIEARPDSPEAGVAHRAAGMTCWFAGEYREARDHLERALALIQPGRDDDLAFRFGHDPGVGAMGYLAIASWPLGEVDRAISLIDRMQLRIADLTHVGTLARGRLHAAMFELMRGDHARGAINAFEVAQLAREHDLPMFRAFGVFLQGWATAASGAPGSGLENMRRGVEQLREQNVLNFDGLLKIALAEAEARAGDPNRAIAILDEALATSDRTGYRAFEAELHRARGEILLKRDPANPAAAEDAFLTAIAVAKQQGTRSFELRAALSLAKLYQSTGRPADAHAFLAPALDGFAPTSQMPEFVEAQALLTALAATEEVRAETAQRQRLTQLHVAYGNALIAARGFGAPETTEAFTRARESASGDKDAPERLAADYGLWVGSFNRGELPSMRAHAAAFLSDVEARPDSPEAGVAHRAAGSTCWFAGEYREARDHFERALVLFEPGRDDDLAFRFGYDPGVGAMALLAIASWPLGEVDRAISLIDRMQTRMANLTLVGALAVGRMYAGMFELMRGHNTRGATNAFEVARLAREHDLHMFRAFGVFFEGWATAATGAVGGGLEDMRRGVELLREQNVLIFDGLFKIALAEAETRAGDPDHAIAILDEALATCDRLGSRAFEAELHRARGEILLKRDPANPAPAEEAFLTAIAVAKQQGTRSFELRAALALAKLYQSTARPADAHAVLAPALDGFSPTPEMPEIAEGQALLGALADSEEVKTAVAQRDRRLRLQTAYGQAMMYSKGFAADETKAAFARAAELAANSDDFSERFAAFHGQWTLAFTRGELKSARELASTFLREAEAAGRMVEAGVARRGLARMSYFAGDFAEARIHCERALENCGQGREREPQESLGEDTGATAMSCLAATMWQLGEVDRARELIEAANRRAAELGHVPSMVHPLRFKSYLENLRGDAAAALTAAEALEALSREHGMHHWRAIAELHVVWARSRLDDPSAGAAELQRALARVKEHGESLSGYWFVIAQLAQSEVQTLGAGGALARINEALALASQVERHCDLPFAHLLRGEILLTLDPANPAPAEEAFGTALAMARQQGARSWGLRAALSLAKLHQSTGRPADALAVLAPALEGFSPTPELPEIAEAQALLMGLMQAMT